MENSLTLETLYGITAYMCVVTVRIITQLGLEAMHGCFLQLQGKFYGVEPVQQLAILQ
jgi:hypothetical protein